MSDAAGARAEVAIIGAGVIGLACGRALAAAGREVVVLERHRHVGSETSSRNSEVIHAGIYYPTGSAKARLCVRGKALLYDYCSSRGVPHRRCGKLIVASDDAQIEVLRGYQGQARRNGAGDLEWLSAEQVTALEPEVRAVAGVWSPSTGIIDSHACMLALQGDLEGAGGVIAFATEVTSLARGRRGDSGAPLRLTTTDFELEADWVINAAGLAAPVVARWLAADAPRAWYARGR